MKKFQELKAIIANAESDAVKFYEKGNKAAGRRLRAAMQQVKRTAQNVRIAVTANKNAN
ncbi:hypothetical protein BDD43_0166 [Mucilaginibacter gracilis]|uniref:Histone H1-like protein Hc1 n=1 Tax=Mucilaginibacter gracilis TaxID=423350 RepID=A0A495IU58_9SPHI|nr:histone H1 [Mucilaginibacter gracilis]RKR80073.1 hypothetical protein BDD43_0166 [Mucilaginibacter gracilis]